MIRTWSLKRQGEYQCPRCGGISNIYLSPLIYVLGLLAIFTGGVIYFFHKFVLDDITLKTALYVFIPFAAFFLISLFMVYLEKPVIKKISRAEYENKHRFLSKKEEVPATNPPPSQEYQSYFEEEDYVPRNNYRPGPSPRADAVEQSVINQQAFNRAKQQAVLENSQRVSVPGNTPVSRPQSQAAAAPQRQGQPVRPTGQQVRQNQAVQQVRRAPQAQQIQPVPRRQGMQSAQKAQNGYHTQQDRAAAPAPRTSQQQRATFTQQGLAAQQRAGRQGINQERPAGQSGRSSGTAGGADQNRRGNLQ